MTSANSGTTHAHPPYSGYRGVVTRMPELHGTVLHVGGVVDVGFGILWWSALQTHILATRLYLRMFSNPHADDLHFLKASVDNAVPMPTVIDASTLAEMFGLTGTAGCFCCGLCQNVTSTARHNPRCVHYAWVDPSMFGTHMHTTFIELCDVVVNGAADIDKTELRLVQKCTGPSWPHGCVAFGRYARKLPDMANMIYCVCIGQFTLNARAVILT